MDYELSEDEKRRKLIDDRQGIVARRAEIVVRILDPLIEIASLRKPSMHELNTAEEVLVTLRLALDALEQARHPAR